MTDIRKVPRTMWRIILVVAVAWWAGGYVQAGASSASASQLLVKLQVATEQASGSYDRDLFNPWKDIIANFEKREPKFGDVGGGC